MSFKAFGTCDRSARCDGTGGPDDFDKWVQGDLYSLGMTAVTLATLRQPKQSQHWPDYVMRSAGTHARVRARTSAHLRAQVHASLSAPDVVDALSPELTEFIRYLLRWVPRSKSSQLSSSRALSYVRELKTKSLVHDRVRQGIPSSEGGCAERSEGEGSAAEAHIAEVHQTSLPDGDGRDGKDGKDEGASQCSDALESAHYSDLELTSYPSRLLGSHSDVTDGKPSEVAKRFNEAQEKLNAGLGYLKQLQYRKAESHLSEALDKFEALDERGVLEPPQKIAILQTEGYIGICLLYLGRSKNAQDLVKIGVQLREYLHEDDDRQAAWMLHYADVLMEQNQFVSASTYIDKALRLCDQTGSSSAVCGIRAAGMAKQAKRRRTIVAALFPLCRATCHACIATGPRATHDGRLGPRRALRHKSRKTFSAARDARETRPHWPV